MRQRLIFLFLLLTVIQVCPVMANADPSAWRTAYVQRGWVGQWNAQGKLGRFQYQSEIPIPFAGTKVRVYVFGAPIGRPGDVESVLSSLAFTKGADLSGNEIGPAYPVLFSGSASVQPGQYKTAMGEADAPIKPGIWYAQETFSSARAPYSYDMDGSFWNEDGTPGEAVRKPHPGARYSIISRVDVWTADTRPIVACYGDSITQGYDSTPFAGKRYPTLLGEIIHRPTLNYGVNGDTISRGQYDGPSRIGALAGVADVIFLMGTNDILSGQMKTLDQYQKCAANAVRQFHAEGLKVYWGTISPFKGNKMACIAGTDTFDPDKESLREQINAWIRTSSFGADGVIDFDRALADPSDPQHLNAAYQSDWLHPNDAGYAKMAQVAAAVLHAAH